MNLNKIIQPKLKNHIYGSALFFLRGGGGEGEHRFGNVLTSDFVFYTFFSRENRQRGAIFNCFIVKFPLKDSLFGYWRRPCMPGAASTTHPALRRRHGGEQGRGGGREGGQPYSSSGIKHDFK